MPIRIDLDALLAGKRMTQAELAQRIGITAPNLNVLKTGKAKAIRFSTLSAICRELGCQPVGVEEQLLVPRAAPVDVDGRVHPALGQAAEAKA